MATDDADSPSESPRPQSNSSLIAETHAASVSTDLLPAIDSESLRYTESEVASINLIDKGLIDRMREIRLPALPDLTRSVSKRDKYPAAHGGFADIWICDWNYFKSRPQKVAVKVLRSFGSIDHEHKIDKRLRRELVVWLGLKHPRVLPLYGVVSDFGPYLSMVCPWMENGNLNNYMAIVGESLDLESRYRLLRQICAGLAYLHSRSVVHGDLTGCNVLVDAAGDACLSDFGLSTIISDLQGASTFTSSIGGNVRFAAPELYRIINDDILPLASTESDVYSFGSIMLQIFTGKIPYHYVRTDGQVLIELVRGIRPRRPSDPIITDTRWDFMCSCWANQPSDRPTVDEIQEYLGDPLNTYTSRTTSLPDLMDVERLSMLSKSHGGSLESWTAIRNNEANDAVVVKLFKGALTEEAKAVTLKALHDIGKVTHKNIVPYLGITSHMSNTIGIVMPWIDSRCLCVYLRRAFVPSGRRFLLLRQIADGLSHLHSLTIVHGGLTGWNILIDGTGTAKLGNYGLMPIILQHCTSANTFPTYDQDIRWADPVLWMEPTSESTLDSAPRPTPTFATDVFAFGRVILQILTGNVPFHYMWKDVGPFPATNLDSLTPELFRPQRPSTQLVSDAIWELIMDCCADDPGIRPKMEAISSRITALAPLSSSFSHSQRLVASASVSG